MKLCREVVKYAEVFGIRELRPGETSQFNRRNVGVLLFFGILSISSIATILFDDETVKDYTESFFAWISVFFIGLGVLFNVKKIKVIFDLKKRVEKTVEMRK